MAIRKNTQTEKYRKHKAVKLCVVCNKRLENNQHKYYCTKECYTKFRTGFASDKIICCRWVPPTKTIKNNNNDG